MIAERPFRHLDAAGQDVKVVVVLGLPKGWESLSAISSPAEEEVEGEGGKRAEDWIDMPHASHVFNLPVLVRLPCLMVMIIQGTVSSDLRPSLSRSISIRSAGPPSLLTAGDGSMAYK